MLNLPGSVYQFEREILLERQKVGNAKVKRGKVRGSYLYCKEQVRRDYRTDQTKYEISEITKKLDIGVVSVYSYR